MKAILLTQLNGGSSTLIIGFCFFFLALVFSSLVLWLHKKVKMPGWLVSCFITSFFIVTTIGGILMITQPANATVTVADFVPVLFLLPPLFLLFSTFPLPVSIPLGLAIYFTGRKVHRAKQMTVVGCAVTEHIGGETAFAGAFTTKKKLPAWKVLTGASIVALVLSCAIRLPTNFDGPFTPVKRWGIFWASRTQPSMDGMMDTARKWSAELNKFAKSK
jgi:hypothetical protein